MAASKPAAIYTTLTDVIPAGGFVWSVPGSAQFSSTGQLSRLRGGTLVVPHGASSLDVYNTRTGTRVRYGSIPFNNGWQVFDSDTAALYMQTSPGPRRILVGRVASSTVALGSVVSSLCTRAGLAAGDVNTAALSTALTGYVVARPTSAREAITPWRRPICSTR